MITNPFSCIQSSYNDICQIPVESNDYPFDIEETNFDLINPVCYYTNERVPYYDKLFSFLSLPKNWDGYGGIPPLKDCHYNAMKFIEHLHIYDLLRLNLDMITPTPHGTIEVEWCKDDFYLSVEIGSHLLGYISQLPDGTSRSSEGIILNNNEIPYEIEQALKILHEELTNDNT